jgi:glyoxylase-like metal-dependent hydrolase (beta-lactamase superfamily II)
VRRVLVALLLLLVVLLVFAAGVLGEAHREMRGLDPVLPDARSLAALATAADAPVRASYLNTATQRGGGLPIAHPVFLLEWSDGRLFAIDAGMDRAGALAFGRPMELLLGAEPIEPYGSPGEQLGDAAVRVAGVAFTHLHGDHTGGLPSLCATAGGAEGVGAGGGSRSVGRRTAARGLPVFQTPWQADLGNYTTSPGRDSIARASCATPRRLENGPLRAVPGFDGLAAVAVAGHTPGSTIYAAHVQGRAGAHAAHGSPAAGTTWIFAGDVANFRDSLLENRPKPQIYSLLIVPEAPAVLERLRRWLAALDAEPGFRVVVSHDLEALEASALPRHSPLP